VFARIVTMRLKPNTASEFSQTIEKKILPILRKQKGFRDELISVEVVGKPARYGFAIWRRDRFDALKTQKQTLGSLRLANPSPQDKGHEHSGDRDHTGAPQNQVS